MTDPTDKPFHNNSSAHERLETLFNDRNVLRKKDASTFQRFAESEANADAGRFSAVTKSNVVGAKAHVEYPAGPNWANDPVPPEETIDATDCGATFGVALGEPHEQTNAELERAATQQGDLLPSHAEGRSVEADGSLVGHEVEPPLTPTKSQPTSGGRK